MKKSDRIVAAIVAIFFHLIVLLLFLHTFLKFPPDGIVWPPEPERTIVFDEVEDLYASGEFVRTGDILDPTAPADQPAPSSESNPQPTQDASDATNAGQAANPSKLTTTESESPAKVKKEPVGPVKDNTQLEKERQEAARQQQAKKNVADATSRAFGGGKGQGSPGSVEGNSSAGAIAGTPGNGLKGRTLENWTTVPSTKLGVIAVSVKVDAAGKVVSATYDAAHSSGTVAADAAMRRNCVERSRQCRFSVLEGSPTQSGIITWVFK